MDKGFHPLDQGFDYWYGTKGSNDWDGPKPIIYDAFKNAPESAWKRCRLLQQGVADSHTEHGSTCDSGNSIYRRAFCRFGLHTIAVRTADGTLLLAHTS